MNRRVQNSGGIGRRGWPGGGGGGGGTIGGGGTNKYAKFTAATTIVDSMTHETATERVFDSAAPADSLAKSGVTFYTVSENTGMVVFTNA